MATPLNISLKVTGLDQAKAELQTLATIGQRSFAQLEAQAQRLSVRSGQTDAALAGMAARVVQLTRTVDTAAAANLSYRDSMVAINVAAREGWINTARQIQLTQALREEQQRLRTQIREVTNDIRQLGTIGTQGFNTILNGATRASAGLRPTGDAVLTLAQNMRSLVAELNPAAAANQKLFHTIMEVRQAAALRVITPKEEIAIIAQLRAEFDKTLTSIRAVKAEIKSLSGPQLTSGAAVTQAAGTRGSPKAGSQEQLDLANEMKALAEAANPAAAATQKLADTLIRVQQAQNGYVISAQEASAITQHLVAEHDAYITRLDASAREIRELGVAASASYAEVTRSANALAAANQATGSSYEAVLNRVKANVAAMNPLAAANIKLRDAIAEVHVVRAKGDIDDAQAIQTIERMRVAHDRWVKQQQSALPTLNNTTLSHKQLGAVATQLSFQLNDVATGLASGVNPMTILAQQGGQIIQVFQGLGEGGVGAVIKQLGKSILGLLSPLTLVIAAVTAVAAAVVVLTMRALESQQAQRQFQVTLEAMRQTHQATAEQLEESAKRLRDVGLAAGDARTAILAISRAGLNPTFAEQIIRVGKNLDAAFGGDQVKALTEALGGGIDTLVKYGLQTRQLTTTQAGLALEMARSGKLGEALTLTFGNIQKSAQGLRERSMSPAALAMEKMAVAWSQLMDSMANSKAITLVVDGITKMIDGFDKLFQMKPPTWLAMIMGLVTPGVGIGGGFLISKAFEAANAAAAAAAAKPPALGPGSAVAIPPPLGSARGTEGMDPVFAENIKKMIAKAAEEGLVLGISSLGGKRTFEEQAKIWANAVRKHGSEAAAAKWAARPGTSMHERGIAGDFVDRYGRLVDKGTPEDEFIKRNLETFKMRRPMAHEPWHLQPAEGGMTIGGMTPEAKVASEEEVKAAQRKAEAIRGVGLAQKLAAQEAEVNSRKDIDASTKAAMVTGLHEAAVTELANEIANAASKTELEIIGQTAIAEAYKVSSAAGQDLEQRVAAGMEAFEKFGDVSTSVSKKFAQDRKSEMVSLKEQAERIQNNKDLLQEKDTQEVLKLQTQLVGQTTEEITKQVSLLQAKLEIEKQFPNLSKEEVAARLAAKQLTADMVKNLADVQREQNRVDDLFRKIGSTLESAIGDVIDGIFDPKKAIDWGKKVKEMAIGLFKDIAISQFARPMIGNLLGSLGASANLVQSMGGGAGTVGGAGSSFNLGTLFQGGSFLKDMFPETAKMLGAGINAPGGLGSSLGFGYSVPGLTAAEAANAGIAGGAYMPEGITVPGSIFGSTTIGSAAMGVGMGFMGGTMLNSLLGGKQTGGMIGSGVGSLAGLALTPFLGPFGPILGGLAGGALGGMFGNSKPSNASAGANIDLSQFRITSGFAGGNQQIDAQVQQMGQTLQGFLDLLSTTGGQLSGNVLLQSGVNTGITVDSSLEGFEGRFNLGKDTEAAIKIIEQALVKSVTGVSETMKTVLSQVGTDEDIAKAIQFAKVYDDISTAAEGAFSSIEDASKKIGPFRQAFDEINILFADLTVQATRFGLSLEPLNEALAEATTRLQDDFTNAISEAILAASGDQFINDLSSTIENYIASAVEASAIGLTDLDTGNQLGTLFMAQINDILDDLDVDQLTEVVIYFGAQADAQSQVVASLGQEMLNTTRAAEALENSIGDLAERAEQAAKDIQAYIDQITATAGSSVSPETAYLEAQAQFAEQLAKAQTGDVEALESITEYADRLIAGIEGYYGSAEAGTAEFDAMVAALQGLVIPTQTAHIDPGSEAVVNTLTDIAAVSQPLAEETVAGIVNGTSSLVQSNSDAATAAITANDLAMETLTGVVNKTAEDNMALNTESTTALLEQATDDTAALLADAEVQRLALQDANTLASEDLIAENLLNSEAAIAKATETTQAIIDDNKLKSEALIAAGQFATTELQATYDKASEDALAESQAQTDTLKQQTIDSMDASLAANELATEALKTGADANTVALLDSDKLTRDEIIKLVGSTVVLDAITNMRDDLHEELHLTGEAVIGAIDIWAPLQITAISDAAASINENIALWLETSTKNDTDLANNSILSNTDLTNSIIAGQGIAADTIVGGLETWFKALIADNLTLTNSLINTGSTYANAQSDASFLAADSIIASEKTYHSNTVLAIKAAETNTITWLKSIESWVHGIYNVAVESLHEAAALQRQDMINKLQAILNELRLFNNAPPVYGGPV